MTTELKGEVVSGDFNPEQKRYLEGFMAGAQIAKAKNVVGAAPAISHSQRTDRS